MEAAIAKALQQKGAAQQPDNDFESGRSEGDEEEEQQSGSSEREDDDSGDEPDSASEDGESEGDEGMDVEFDEADDDGAEADTEGEADSSDEDGSDPSERKREKPTGFLEGGKADAFARAFANILEKAEHKGAESHAAPILMGSKSIAKRKAEAAETAQHDKEAKRLRIEMKQRGHLVPTKRGKDPAADAREKGLQRLATRGVVRLFNAIAKAQKQVRDAQEQTGNKARAAKLGRASFLAELKGGATSAGATGADKVMVPSAPGQAAALAAPAAAAAAGGTQQRRGGAQRQQQQQQQQQAGGESSSEEEDAGWEVLQKGFVGLQGGSKMKDWDKQVSDDGDSPGEEMDDDSD